MALASYQKLTRVLPGQPFGDGADGAYSSATIPTMTYRSCSGTATQTTLTIGSAGFSNGDVVLIHQTRGTGVGQWEINQISSGGGSTTLTLSQALQFTYTDSGNSQAQVVKIPRYTSVTVQSGTWSVVDWDEDKGGILTFAASVGVTVTGNIVATAAGFLAGAGKGTVGQTGDQGEGTTGARAASTSANGSGGGGGQGDAGGDYGRPGGGGGHSAAGTAGSPGGGAAGGQVGAAELTTLVFGGAGAGGGSDDGGPGLPSAPGGDSGGIVAIFANDISIAGSIVTTGANGSTGGNQFQGSGGGGSGGAVLLEVGTATLGTNLITALGGTGGSNTNNTGGDGSSGRIAVHHSGSVTGTTNPTFSDTTDSSLVVSTGGVPANYFYFM